MNAQWMMALAPLAGLAANCAVQLTSFRLLRVKLLKSIVIGFGAGLAVDAALVCWACALASARPSDWVGQIAVTLLTVAALGYGYFHFINLGETARRVRILREFVEAGGTLDEAGLLRRYNGAQIVQIRLQRLLSSGQVSLREGRYALCDPTVARMASIIRLLKQLLLGRSGEPPAVPGSDVGKFAGK
jgi:hypothetical protein